jgi:hypothetical protein
VLIDTNLLDLHGVNVEMALRRSIPTKTLALMEKIMPLPAMKTARRCKASTKSTGKQCENPAAYGMPVCRLHGARRRSTVRVGADHWNYQHGQETLEAKRISADTNTQLSEIQRALKKIGAL